MPKKEFENTERSLHLELTPVDLERLKAAIRLIVNYILDRCNLDEQNQQGDQDQAKRA